MDELKFAGRLTLNDYKVVASFSYKKLYIISALCILLVVTMDLLSGGFQVLSSRPVGTLLTWLPMLLLIPALPFMQNFALKRNWRKNKIMQLPVKGSVTEEGIKWEFVGASSVDVSWDLLLRYRESAKVVLIYSGVRQVLFFFPHYFENEAQWNSFRELVRKKLPRK
ncbi:hypothetical protein [Desulfatibacillum aliphaticivorans]|uniref:hypothetical protein n=1 Tax=Desulfatibacillum aliphaticivorans TaxID=218208 RepID=UPI0004870073|nr:hypothetical protein [Desulfatibacillum aliphaticivorans]